MNEKEIKRHTAIIEKLNNYPKVVAQYYNSLLADGKSLGTARTYMSSIFQFLDYCYGNHIPADFYYSTSENDVILFLDSLKAKGKPDAAASGSAKAAVWSALMSFFSYISSKYPQIDNPVKNIRRPSMTQKSPSDLVYLTSDETKILLDSVEWNAGYEFVCRDKSIVMLGLFCGLRINEILDLNIKDVDLEMGTLRIYDPKKGVRTVSLSDSVERELKGWLVRREYNFANSGTQALFVSQVKNRLSSDRVQKFLNRYSEGLEKHVTPRVLRNTFAVNLYKKTKDIILLSKYLDHASIATTQRYIEQLSDDTNIFFDIDNLYD